MYAHHVIDSLLKIKNKSVIYRERINKLVKMFKSAQCFYFNDCNHLVKLTPLSWVNEPMFSGRLGEFITLPYPICWFEFFDDKCPTHVPGRKSGCLLIEQSHIHHSAILVVPFTCLPGNMHFWCPPIFEYLIIIGKPIDHDVFAQIQKHNKMEVKSTGDNIIKWQAPYLDMYKPLGFIELDAEWAINREMASLIYLNAALMLLNCGNVKRREVVPEERVNRKRVAAGKQPLFRYHTLEVELPSTSSGSHADAAPTGRTMPVHLCRGHFKTFTEEAPLFGRYVGRWLWKPVLRGNVKNGMVVKDYNIKGREREGSEVGVAA